MNLFSLSHQTVVYSHSSLTAHSRQR